MNSKYTLLTALVIAIVIGAVLLFTSKTPASQTPPDSDQQTVSTIATTTAASPDWILVTDSQYRYSIEIPSDWKISPEGNRLEGKSLDWQTELSPPDNELNGSMHIVKGAAIEIYVFSEDIGGAPSKFFMKYKSERSDTISISGVTGKIEYFRENDLPLHAEDIVIKGSVTDKNTYYFRISYNPMTYPQGEYVFMHMLNSVRFEK